MAAREPTPLAPPAPRLGLGLDVGGTATRWALADDRGAVLAQGQARPFSGQQVASSAGRAAVAQVLAELAQALQARMVPGTLHGVCAGVTGHDQDAGPELQHLLQSAMQLTAGQVQLCNDVELACRLAYAPGNGALVYAGTGAIAVFVDAGGHAHRVGGRGALLGDEGGAYWIARQALARLWRREDDLPGSAAATPLGCALFAAVGGPAWNHTRHFVQTADRCDFANLARAVAAVAEQDPQALAVLQQAGVELARLAARLLQRFGAQLPLGLAGGAFKLHPAIERSLVAALPAGAVWRHVDQHTEVAAAQRAAAAVVDGSATGLNASPSGPHQP